MEVRVGLLVLVIVAPLYGLTLINVLPPQVNDAARARYIMHKTDWISVTTTSTQPAILGYPFVTVKSMSDGSLQNSTGVPYIYQTPLDLTGKDIEKDNRCTILASLAETAFCHYEQYDPQDPRCARVMITGRLVKVDNRTAEYEFGKNALFSRHPTMKTWPKDHGFYVAKVQIQQILLLDYFGGVKNVSINDYYNVNLGLGEQDELLEDVMVVDVEA